MGRRLAALALVVLACGGAGRTPVTPSRPAPPLVVDPLWLGALSLPVTAGKPLVVVEGATGVLMEDTPDHFTVFDGLETTVHSKLSAGGDDAPPDHYERADPRRAPSLLGHSELAETVQTAVFALLMKERGQDAVEDELLHRLGDDIAAVRERVQKTIPLYLASEAMQAYAKGGPREALERDLARAGGQEKLLALVHALGDPDPPFSPKTPLDALVHARVRELRETRCDSWPTDSQWPGTDAVGRVRSLGLTALAALVAVESDPRPTRCLAGDPPSLETIGQVATRLAGTMKNDTSDVECGHDGSDKEALDLVDAALAKHEVARAVSIARSALGNIRVHMLERIATAGGAPATSFLSEEAKTGPVVLARVEAARALGARGDVSWAGPLAGPVGAALADEDAGVAKRCDQSLVVLEGFDVLLRFVPGDALKLAAGGFSAYGPKARVRIASSLSTLMTKNASDAKARDAILSQALADTRPFKGMTMTLGGMRCTDPSPSDVAAIPLGKRLGVPYSCNSAATEKATAVQGMLGKLGKP